MADCPVVVDVSKTEPVPIFESPPDPELIPVGNPRLVPSDVTARSDTPFSLALPPTDTEGKNDCNPSAPRTLELVV